MTIDMLIREKYINSFILPNEECFGWIKWDNIKLEFDKLIFATEADIKVVRFFNIKTEIINSNNKDNRFIIDKNYLKLDGFFGFVAKYLAIPEEDRDITFRLDFMKGDSIVKRIELSTKVIIPKLDIKLQTEEIIELTGQSKKERLEFSIESIGKAIPRKVRSFVKIIRGSKDVNVDVNEDEDEMFITVKGQGYTAIQFGFEYEDSIGNKYSIILPKSVVINKQTKEDEIIPLYTDKEEQLLVA